jgi:hypothetical protein
MPEETEASLSVDLATCEAERIDKRAGGSRQIVERVIRISALVVDSCVKINVQQSELKC